MVPVRVLYLRDTAFVCGPGKTILNTFRTADRSNVSIALGIPGWTSAANPLITAAQSIGLPIVPLPDSGRVGVMAARRLATVIEDGEFDLVQSHDFRTRRLATLACTLASVPHVTSVHGWIVNSHRQRLARIIDQRLIRRARRIIAVSNRLVSDLVESGAPRDRITLFPNAVLLDDYPPAMPADQARRELGVPASSKCIGIVGRLSPEKRHDLFLEMAAELASSDPDVVLLVVGQGPLQSGPRVHRPGADLHYESIETAGRGAATVRAIQRHVHRVRAGGSLYRVAARRHCRDGSHDARQLPGVWSV